MSLRAYILYNGMLANNQSMNHLLMLSFLRCVKNWNPNPGRAAELLITQTISRQRHTQELY